MRLFVAIFFLLLFLLPITAFGQTEVVYPDIFGVLSPQDIIEGAQEEKDILPLFVAYIFRLLLFFAVVVFFGVVIYGGILYIASSEDPERKKQAKSWIVSAIQGTLIVFISYGILLVIDSRFLHFGLSDLEEREEISYVELEWDVKDVYFQIPLGKIIEDSGVSRTARDKLYDVLDATVQAEAVADAIVVGGYQLLDIIEECPDEETCCDDFPYYCCPDIPYTPPLPVERSNSPLISPVEHVQYIPIQNVSIAHRGIIWDAIDDVLEKFEDVDEENFKRKIKNVIEEIEKVIDKDGPTSIEGLRAIRRVLEDIYNQNEGLIESFEEDVQDALAELLYSLPKGDIGFEEFPYYYQCDPEWGQMLYGSMTYCDSACAGVSTAMVLSFLLERRVTPMEVRNYSTPYIMNGSWTEGLVENAANQYPELGYKKINSVDELFAEMDKGHPIILGGQAPPYSYSRLGGHAIALTDIDREKGIVYLNDPGHPFLHVIPMHRIKRNPPNGMFMLYRLDGRIPGKSSKNYYFVKDKKEEIRNSKEKSFYQLDYKESLAQNLSFLNLLNIQDVFACGPDCPEISPAVAIKIKEIRKYMIGQKIGYQNMLLRLLDAKYPVEEDLFHLYKAVMIKSLGHRYLVDYNDLLSRRFFHERKEIDIQSYREIKELPNYWRTSVYFWDWRQWIENVIYRIMLDDCVQCDDIREENDPITFYLRMPEAEKITIDAERLGRTANFKKKMEIPPYFWELFRSSEKDKKDTIASKKSESFFSKITENYGISLNLLNRKEEIFVEATTTTDTPADYLRCGMEIPIGEAFDILWAHLVEITEVIDRYIEEGVVFLELQEEMNILAEPCSCPCVDPMCEMDPPICGACILTCDKEAIYDKHAEVVAQKALLAKIAEYIEFLTDGYFDVASEDICDPLNIEIRSREERMLCDGGGIKLVPKHEIVVRKLNYSRFRFDECFTRRDQAGDVIIGESAGGKLIFGPLAEAKSLERYTKTERCIGGDCALINTSDFNWFCCTEFKPDKDD